MFALLLCGSIYIIASVVLTVLTQLFPASISLHFHKSVKGGLQYKLLTHAMLFFIAMILRCACACVCVSVCTTHATEG